MYIDVLFYNEFFIINRYFKNKPSRSIYKCFSKVIILCINILNSISAGDGDLRQSRWDVFRIKYR